MSAPLPSALDALLRASGIAAPSLDAPLALSSLQVVQLVDAIEVVHDLFLPADAITRANFETPRAILALLEAHGLELL